MSAYHNQEAGFELDLPSDWFLPPRGEAKDIQALAGETVEILGETGVPEVHPDYMERQFAQLALNKRWQLEAVERITAGSKEHLSATFLAGRETVIKQYAVTFPGLLVFITLTAHPRTVFERREETWDQMVRSFRLAATRRNELKTQDERRAQTGGALYQRAYELVSGGRYEEARGLLEQCVSERSDHALARKELAVVLRKLGDIRGAVAQRREVCLLDPTDQVNRYNLANLLATLGEREAAAQEVEALLRLDRHNPLYLAACDELKRRPITHAQFYDEARLKYPGEPQVMRLQFCHVLASPYLVQLIVEYGWAEGVPVDVARNLTQRCLAYVCCAIFDAASYAQIGCAPSPIPNGMRPAWVLEGERSPVSLTLSDINEEERACQFVICPVVTMMGAAPSNRSHWERLCLAFQARFPEICV